MATPIKESLDFRERKDVVAVTYGRLQRHVERYENATTSNQREVYGTYIGLARKNFKKAMDNLQKSTRTKNEEIRGLAEETGRIYRERVEELDKRLNKAAGNAPLSSGE